MFSSLARREFFKQTALLTAGLGAAASLSSVAAATDPVQRNGRAKFKFSLAAYSYRNLLSGKEPAMTLKDFIADCATMDLEGTELTSYYFPEEPTDEYIAGLKHAAFTLGLDISGTAIRNDFCYPPGEQRQAEIAHVKRWIDYAQKLGAPVIRVFSGRERKDQTFEQAYKAAVEAMHECCDYAGSRGVFLALENHGGLSTRIDDLVSLVKDVNSPWLGVNLDTGNFQAAASADEAYIGMAQMAPYALNVQVKVAIALDGGKKAESDFSRLAKILTDADYRGYIVLEYEEKEDPQKACPRYVKELREAFA